MTNLSAARVAIALTPLMIGLAGCTGAPGSPADASVATATAALEVGQLCEFGEPGQCDWPLECCIHSEEGSAYGTSQCTSLIDNDDHCGFCGRRCGDDERCVYGVCRQVQPCEDEALCYCPMHCECYDWDESGECKKYNCDPGEPGCRLPGLCADRRAWCE